MLSCVYVQLWCDLLLLLHRGPSLMYVAPGVQSLLNNFTTVQGQAQLLPQLPARIRPHLPQLQVHLHPASTPLPHSIQAPTHQLPLHLPQQVLPQLLTKGALLNGRSVAAPTSAPPTVQMRHGVICSVTVG